MSKTPFPGQFTPNRFLQFSKPVPKQVKSKQNRTIPDDYRIFQKSINPNTAVHEWKSASVPEF